MRMFGEITKVEAQDDGTIKVVGVASSGAVDDADETVLPDAMKAALPAYMRIGALSEMHGVTLAGGDTSESPGGKAAMVLADIVLLGTAPKGKALRRSGGAAGDAIYVTGHLGGAAAEWAAMQTRGRITRAATTDGHPQMFPEPRLDAGEALLRRGLASACMDISDGLSTDLAHLCRASGVDAEIEQAALPIHPLARKLGADDALRAVLHGGEDYELLFTAPASVRMPGSLAGVPVTRIPPGRLEHPPPSPISDSGFNL